MKLFEITNYLEEVAPLRFQENYDNSGLLVGHKEMEITGAMISLDATEAIVDEAIANGCNLVISHHPILFRGIKKFDPSFYVDQAIIKAIKNDVALYAIHTNLDNVLNYGVNQKIAQKLRLQEVNVLKSHGNAPMEINYEVGAGAVGNLEEEMNPTDFLAYLKDKMSLKMIKHTQLLEENIKRVAVCGGSGSFLLSAAKDSGAQAFITSDFKYHEFFDANNELVIIDIGHYESEYFTIELIFELISKKFPNFAAHYTKQITNPVFYF